jgi:hypothetical protein
MLSKAFIFSGLFTLILVFYGCCKAGTGGNATVVCHVTDVNTGKAVTNATVYIYYGSSTPPANVSKFDASKLTGTKNSTVTFAGLKCGTYYLYATAYDSLIHTQIQGGGPYSLKHSNRNKSGDAYISVSY